MPAGTGLTFAEAYMLRKAKEIVDDAKKKEEPQTLVSNIDELHKLLAKFKESIDKLPLKQMKQCFKGIAVDISKHIADWRDEDHLDILHHAIINNRPDLVAYLLMETHYFPIKHTPPANPYAHLAAFAGHTECLRTILLHRPGSFFPGSDPCHAIKLPPYCMRKLRVSEKGYSQRASTRVIEEIKHSTKIAEKKMKSATSSPSTDVASVLSADLDQPFGEKPKKVLPHHAYQPRRSVDFSRKDRQTTAPSKTMFTTFPAVSSISPTSPKPSSKKTTKFWKPPSRSQSGIMEAKDCDHFFPRMKPRSKKHLITLYWNKIGLLGEGVIKGAGEPIEVVDCPSQDRSDISLAETINIMSWPTALSRKRSDTLAKKQSYTGSVSTPKRVSSERATIRNTKKIDIGIRSMKKYKEFKVKLPSRDLRGKDDPDNYTNKTPLTLAAERGHEDCVQLILETVVVRRNPTLNPGDPLTLATKARSPETIFLLLEKSYSKEDYQSAVLLSIREMYPVCLTALLGKGKGKLNQLFEGVNLYHMLYSQCVTSNHRYELMAEMTRALVACREDVNAHNIPRTYPMYTLINCAFNITTGKQIFFFIDCLHILLENKANPHYDEAKQGRQSYRNALTFSRNAFSSAINCIFESAKGSINFFEKPYWSKLFMNKFITTLEMHDRTNRRVLNTVLFEYMNAICELGLDRTIVRCLLRYGANPDYQLQDKFAVNVYFDILLPYMTKFEILDSYDHYRQELDTLMIICKNMSNMKLRQALSIFLQDHLLSAPIQALPITRTFAALMDQLMRTPRPLVELTARCIWRRLSYNKTRVKRLPIPADYVGLIIP